MLDAGRTVSALGQKILIANAAMRRALDEGDVEGVGYGEEQVGGRKGGKREKGIESGVQPPKVQISVLLILPTASGAIRFYQFGGVQIIPLAWLSPLSELIPP
ncbi:hypothetical protein A0H81_00601 [Grifola frondosa]|uniref:Uncharacterized protein n=1 Tax=Grifola frondosa TaxID=5627 RepID=A0A1C7MQV0_GRIFR|nr:hypothetical protein A0H81_00601 [Grifola frondosa]